MVAEARAFLYVLLYSSTLMLLSRIYALRLLFAAKIRPRWSSPSAGSALTCDDLQIHDRHTRCFIIAPKPSLYSAFLSTGLGRLSVKIDYQKATPQDLDRANNGCLLRFEQNQTNMHRLFHNYYNYY